MDTATLIYHFAVLLMGIVLFFLKVTAPSALFELILKTIGKLIPLFCIFYAGVQIFKYFGIL